MLTSYTEDSDTSTDHVLVFARPINASVLADMAEKYHLPGLGLAQIPPAFWQAGYDIETVDRRHLGFFVWNPELAGFRMLPLLALGVLVVYLGMYLSARMFFHRATDTVRALAEAKHQADKVKELLANQVRSDPLTGLGNRRLLDEKLALLQDVKPLADGHALLYVDLDRFKEINDTYGHETGDLVLLHVAEALTGLVNADDTVVRLGGDEFVIVFGRARRERVLSASRAIVEQLSRPVNLDGATYTFGASVGVAFSHKLRNCFARRMLHFIRRNGGAGHRSRFILPTCWISGMSPFSRQLSRADRKRPARRPVLNVRRLSLAAIRYRCRAW